MALNEFEGTVMLVSHDRALLREVCDEFWLVADGALKPFDGDLDDYQRWLLERSRAAAREASGSDKRAKLGALAHRNKRAATDPPARNGKSASPTGPGRAGAPATVAGHDARKAAATGRRQQADLTRPLRRELNQVDNRLGVLFAERDALEASFAAEVAPSAVAEGGRRLKVIAEEIEQLEGRWLELSTQIDELAGETARS